MNELGFSSQSASIAKIAPALLKAQKAIGPAEKGAKNPFFNSKYADLGAVLEACKEQLNENGIIILQPISSNGEGICVMTTLLHESGEFISSQLRISPNKQNDPQAQGSAITYARRYGLQAMLSIPAEDDDGNLASGKTVAAVTTRPAQTVPKTAEIAPGTILSIFMPSKVESRNKKAGGVYYVISDGANEYSTLKKDEYELAQKAMNQGKEIKLAYSVNGKFNNVKSISAVLDAVQEILEEEPPY